jgi:hypothetical protein
VARENKVLYVTVVQCKNLVVGDLFGTSDPYCEISCNNVVIRSSTKYRTLNPVYNETFEIDVTNPGAFLHIVIKDYDVFGSHDFLGQVRLPLSDYTDGLEHRITVPLKSEDLYSDKVFDNGEIELKIYWTERKYDDDLINQDEELASTIRLQCWIRRILAKCLLRRLQIERKKFLRLIQKRAIQITNTCRIRLARKELKYRQRRVKAAIKIQKRIRIFLAKRSFARMKYEYKQNIILQKYVRGYLARMKLRGLKASNVRKRNAMAITIQRVARGFLARQQGSFKRHRPISSINANRQRKSVFDWLKILGYDDNLGNRRTNRIMERAFEKMLTMKYMRFVSSYGILYLNQYPIDNKQQLADSSYWDDDEDSSMVTDLNTSALVPDKDFASMFLPSFRTIGYQKQKAVELILITPYTITCHMSSCIKKRQSVDYTVTIIQCAFRMYSARKIQRRLKVSLISLIRFQRIFRKKHKRLFKAAYTIQSLYRLVHAKLTVRRMKREYLSALCIQCAYRCHLAYVASMNKRSVDRIVILKCSSYVPNYEPQKCLEHREQTFWMTDSPDYGELRVEFETKECISAIWIMASTYSASPQFVSVSAVVNKQDQRYENFIQNRHLTLLTGPRWHKIRLPGVVSKFFRIAFYESYGDEKHISVRQIRFIRSQEGN